MDWGSAVIGIGGLLVAALSLWLSYKERRATHRQALYAQQVEAFGAVIGALFSIYRACFDFIERQPGHKLNRKTRPQMRKVVNVVYQEFEIEWAKRLLLLPSVVRSEIATFIKLVNAISATDKDAQEYPSELINSLDPQTDLSTAYKKVLEVASQRLGIEPLSQDIEMIVRGGFPHH